MGTNQQIATLAGGCFWCLEAAFNELKGVENVVSGYAGGNVPHPTYEQVCTGETGHAEAVQITFDTDLLSFGDLLRIFFSLHDPTTLNRQGPDAGTQYRSAIFYHDETQRVEAEEVIRELTQAGLWDNPIVTEVMPFTNFYPAEAYHQNYFARNPWQPYCRTVVAPKVAKFRKQFVERIKSNI